MFPTFSGNSRRPRNVNLSGQTNANPFLANSWSPSGVTGASRSVTNAQAERRQRQQERERLKAAADIQRTWRGHRARRTLRETRRRAFDDLYPPSLAREAGSGDARVKRLTHALPLVLAFFQASCKDDLQRLAVFVEDLAIVGCIDQVPAARSGRLFFILIAAANQRISDSAPAPSIAELDILALHLSLLVAVLNRRRHAISKGLGPYFRLLAKFHALAPTPGSAAERSMVSGVTDALAEEGDRGTFVYRAYQAFVMDFLTNPLEFFENRVSDFAKLINLDACATAVLDAFASQKAAWKTPDELFWLLAHFTALLKHQAAPDRNTLHLKVMFTLVTHLSNEIRLRLPRSHPNVDRDEDETSSDHSEMALPRYVVDEIKSIVSRDEMSTLVEKFSPSPSEASGQDYESASVLAGYILALIRCFPEYGDDIRTPLVLANISTRAGKLSLVKFFWNAMNGTSVFNRVLSPSESPLAFLVQRNHLPQPAILGEDSAWDREWRTVLLFLELYTFVLRLTDDEDFFAGLGSSPFLQAQPSRVREWSLPLNALTRLSLFLKNLAFELHYNSALILQDRVQGGDGTTFTLDDFTTTLTQSYGRTRETSGRQNRGTYTVVSGIDFSAFKSIVTTALQNIYERDSRRPFLPDGHWLMTAKFDMNAFSQAVVLEEQRQREQRESRDGSDDNDEDGDEEADGPPALTLAGHRRNLYARMEEMKTRQRKANRARMRAALAPKLEILRNMPYVIPFSTRVHIFRQFVHLDKERRRDGNIDPDMWRNYIMRRNGGPWDPHSPAREIIGRYHAEIKRGSIFTDAMEQFWGLGEGLKEPIQITFIDKFDTVEAGIDGGGVTKEFLTSVTQEAFSDQHNLFVVNRNNALYPNPLAVEQRKAILEAASVPETDARWSEQMKQLLDEYEFLGRIVGKCLYEGILLDIAFAGFFLLKWSAAATGHVPNTDELREMDEELYQGMLRLKKHPGNVSDFALDFTIEDQVSLPGEPVRTKTRELMPNGAHTPVTNENRLLYIPYVARHRLVVQPHQQTRAFLRGLGMIIRPSWIAMFNQNELQRLVGGDSSEIDIEDLQAHTIYSGVYEIGNDGLEHPTIKLFWQVMRRITASQRRDVLKYVTSTPRAPLLGFSQLRPRFSIRDGGADQDRLPSASTCVNLLKLPRYNDAATLEAKLLYAVTSGAGFDLS